MIEPSPRMSSDAPAFAVADVGVSTVQIPASPTLPIAAMPLANRPRSAVVTDSRTLARTKTLTDAPIDATPSRRRRLTPRSVTGQVLLYAVLAGLALVYIYPFLVQVATSFKSEQEAASNPISLIPQTFTTAAYERLFLNSDFPLWFANSAVVTILVGDPQGLAGLMKQVGLELVTLKFGRAQETEADVTGLHLLQRAKIDPAGMIRFFERLSEKDQGRMEWISTHPMSKGRAERLKAELASLPKRAPEPFSFNWKTIQNSLGVQPVPMP